MGQRWALPSEKGGVPPAGREGEVKGEPGWAAQPDWDCGERSWPVPGDLELPAGRVGGGGAS